VSATIRIESHSRWDALALTRSLDRYRWHLLQTDPDHWYVCLSPQESPGELPDALLGVLRRWHQERALTTTVVHLQDGRIVEIGSGSSRTGTQ
jgi:hypothetical protein